MARIRSMVTLVLFLAAATIAGAQEMPVHSAGSGAIGPRDVVDIRVIEDPTLNVTRGTVGADGKLTMDLLGKVDLSGLSPQQAEARIKSLLEAKYMNRATVIVQVVEYGSKPISVVGSVTRPGTISTTSTMTLIQALTAAGGLAPGYGRELYVLRTGPMGLTEQVSIDIEDLMVNGNPDLNIPLAPNDVVNVPVDTPITIYVLGEVMKPGKAQFRRSQTPTLLQALADVGGPTDRASRNVIIKRWVSGKESTIRVDYGDILRDKRPDVVLQENDTVFVKESLF